MLPSGGDKKPSRRRVPDSLRRRTLVSCDRCKTRRIRCYRTNENESCTNCLTGGVKCESTLPRKHRVYGSVERFSLRYRALDALVRGLFPDEDTDDVEVLFQLAKNRNISMPSPDHQSPAAEAFSHDQPIAPGTPSADSIGTQATNYEFSASDVVYERMVQGPGNVLHYVGPSSSSEFASIIRHMVTKYKTATSKSRCDERERDKYRAEMPSLTRASTHGSYVTATMHEGAQKTTGLSETSKQLSQANPPSRNTPSQDSSIGTSDHLRDLLPEKHLCDVLVQAFLENLHGSFQVFYKPIFRLRYDSAWDNKIEQTGNSDVGWSCCLFMVIILGAGILGPEQCPDSIAIQTRYMELVRDHFQQLTFTASLENVQALLLLQLYEHNSGERNTCWLVLGLAARMAITLGMHREGTYSSFDTTESHTRRIVWWTLFYYEYNMSSIFGRPPTIDAREVNVLLPHDDVLDGPGYPKGFAEHYLELTNIGHRIRRLITTVTAKYTDEQALLSYHPHVKIALQELEAWRAQLPHHLTPQSQVLTLRHRRAVLTLQATYYHNKSVLTRPFLICKSNRKIDSLFQAENHTIIPVACTTDSLSRKCHTSAIAVLDCFLQLAKYGLLDGVAWADFYYICHANLALSLFALGKMEGFAQDREDEASRSKIAAISDIFAKTKLAPTYKIFTKVTIDLAKSVGLGLGFEKPPTEQVGAHVEEEEVIEEQKLASTVGIPLTVAPYSQPSWSTTETMPTVFPPTTDNILAPPGLLGWFHQEANTGLHMTWDMFNLGNIQLSGADYVEAPPQFSTLYIQQQQQQPQQYEHWPGS
jgi:proline utilization trans-activator